MGGPLVRKAINENPIAQIAVLGVLAVVVGFLLLTRMAGGGSSATSTTASSAAATPAPAIDSGSSTTLDPSASSGEPPSPSEGTPPAASTSDAPVGEFVAGPGLPRPVVNAYRDDKTVVLLVLRRRGIDDDQLRQNVERLRGRNEVALFVTNAGQIARYSRITQGVNVDRVPALIVLRPRHLTPGSTPKAILSYGIRGPGSVDQAIRDALYKGPTNLPYHPR